MSSRARSRLLGSVGVGLALLGGFVWHRGVEAELAEPRDLHGAEHATSGECQRCHPAQFESWSHTFHRTMTQEVSDEAVLGDFDDARLDYGGVEARMRTVEGQRVIETWVSGRLRSRAVVERTVGSHRYQQYLARDGDTWWRLPLAWHVAEGRWFHMNGAFLTPDPPELDSAEPVSEADFNRHVTRWNDNCVFCHNVSPDPGYREVAGAARWDTEVAELGVACEACHGPGEEHVRLNADPVRRYALHLGDDRADPSIVNPRRLSPERSAASCGRCHGQRITDDVARIMREGDPFVPGDDLREYSRPLEQGTTLNGREGVFASRFWSDGTPRLTAYEYQGLLASPCEGLTCTSCHGMHEGDPAGQMRPAMRGDAQCTQCHESLLDGLSARAHSHHEAAIECVDCHMPRLVYGLVGAHISHRIEVPSVAGVARPDACALCHSDDADETLLEAAHRWWALPEMNREVPRQGAEPRVRRDVLGGDPVERAIAAEAMGETRGLADERARAERTGVLLEVIESDPYPAVRRIAWRSLRALAPGADVEWMALRPMAPRREREAWTARFERVVDVVRPEEGFVRRERANAAAVAIDIGE